MNINLKLVQVYRFALYLPVIVVKIWQYLYNIVILTWKITKPEPNVTLSFLDKFWWLML